MSKLLVIQHEEGEGLGSFQAVLAEKGFTCDFLFARQDSPLPSYEQFIGSYAGLIAMGGHQSANDSNKDPFLKNELGLIQELLEHKKPYLGICLGGQMLAKACGMPISKLPQQRIGWYEAKLDDVYSKRNPVFYQLTSPLKVFQWHGEYFDFPPQGYRLVKSETNPVEAFCINGNAYGLQFHPEMTVAMIEAWLKNNEKNLQASVVETIRRETPSYLPELQKMSRRIIAGFVSLCRDSAVQAAGF